MPEHDWKLGWKEIKRPYMTVGHFVDICKRCGIGRLNGLTTSYIKADEVTRLLTTSKMPTHFYGYALPCSGDKEDVSRKSES